MNIVTIRKRAILLLWTLSCLALLQNNAAGRQAPAPLDPKVRTGTLQNGFTYYIRKNKTPEGRAILYLVNKAGSILETDEQRGLAHFLEHMAFNGTRHFPKNELVEYLQKSGVRFGADLNAYTAFDETVYQLPVPTNDKTVFRNAMLIMQDWAQGLTLDDAEIDKERGVILEEKRQRLGSRQRIQQQLMPSMVNDSRYADRVPIGTEEVLRKFDHKEIRQFYQDWYRPDLQALIVVGDVDVNAVEKMIRNGFSTLRNPVPEKERTIYNIPLTGANQFVTVTDPEVSSVNITLQIKHPGLIIRTDEDFKHAVLRELFNIMAADRMNEIVQRADAPFISASFGIESLMANLDAFTGQVTVKPEAVKQGTQAWWRELERIKRYGFTETELKRAITNYMSSVEQLYKERDNNPSENYMQEYVQLFLKGVASPGIEYEYNLCKSFLNTITTSDIQQLIKQYVTGINRDINIVGSTQLQDSIPQEEMMTAWIQEVTTSSIAAYVDNKTERTKLMEQLPTPGNIVREAKGQDGITTLTLGNGVKVVLKPTRFQKGQILFRGFSAGGLSLVSDDDFYSGSIAAGLAAASGVGDLTLTELRRILTGKNISVVPYINETTEGFSGQSDYEDLETALQLVYLYFTKPRKDPVAFNRYLEQVRLSFETEAQDPMAVFRDTVSAVLGGYNFRKMKMPKESLDKVDFDKAMMVYKDRFADASGFTFTFVGNFEEVKIKPVLLQYLAALPSQGRQEGICDLHLDHPSGVITKKITYGVDDKAAVVLSFGGPFAFSDVAAAQMDALSNIMTYRLQARLREEEGGVYNASVNLSMRKYPTGQYAFIINFVCDPKRVEMLIISATSELMKLKTEGVQNDDLVKYKATAKGAISRAKQSNDFWLGYLTSQFMNNEEPDVAGLEKNIQKVTAEDVHKAALAFLNYSNYITVTLKPVK